MGVRVKDEGQFKEIYVKALDSLPVGTSVEYAGTTIPDELKGTWLFERGQELSRTEYAKLFSVIGTSYGVGDGSTTFNLPNKCGRVPVGLDENDIDFDTIGETGGSKTHVHSYNNITTTNQVSGPCVVGQTNNTMSSSSLQPYIVKNFIIKVKETRPLASHTVNAYSESESNAYSCDYSNKAFGGIILWTNPSPASDFGAQTVSLDLTNYDMIEIFYKTSITENEIYVSKCLKNYDTGLYRTWNSGTGAVNQFKRPATFLNNGVSFGDTSRAGDTGYVVPVNNAMIPLYIIGYKTGLFPTQQSTRSLNTYSGDIEEKKDIVIDDGGEEKPIDEGNDENNK